jgi:hypothetical protein
MIKFNISCWRYTMKPCWIKKKGCNLSSSWLTWKYSFSKSLTSKLGNIFSWIIWSKWLFIVRFEYGNSFHIIIF